VVVAVLLCVALAAPASAAPVVAQASPQHIWDQMQQWFAQVSRAVQQLQQLSSQAVAGLFEQVRGWLHTGQMAQVTAFIEHLGQIARSLGDPFAWLYQQAVADLHRLIGGAVDQRGSPAWHAANNPRSQQVVQAAVQQRVASAQSARATAQLSQVSRDMSNAVSVAADARQSAQAAYNAAQVLEHHGQAIASTRAGIQMLIAGQAAALRSHGDALQALANRLNTLIQQESISAQQVDELNKSIRDLADVQRQKLEQEEKDRQAAVQSVGGLTQSTLTAVEQGLVHGVMAPPGNQRVFDRLRPNQR
jgi:hypothetical protein